MDNIKKINKILDKSSNMTYENIDIKNLKHKFEIENIFDADKSYDNGVYDLDYNLNNFNKYIDYLKKEEEKDKEYDLKKYKNFNNFVNFVNENSKIKSRIYLNDYIIFDSNIKGTKTSCAIGLYSGLNINKLSLLCKYFILNKINPFDFFKSYFIEIMKINKITQLIFSNLINEINSVNFINCILDEICEIKTETGINKNGGSKIKTWILTDYPTKQEFNNLYCDEDYWCEECDNHNNDCECDDDNDDYECDY